MFLEQSLANILKLGADSAAHGDDHNAGSVHGENVQEVFHEFQFDHVVLGVWRIYQSDIDILVL